MGYFRCEVGISALRDVANVEASPGTAEDIPPPATGSETPFASDYDVRSPLPARRRRPTDFNSPVAPIRQIIGALGVTVLVVLLLAAKGIVHAAEGMPPGPITSVTLAIGNAALDFDEVFHLTWPWDTLESALGQGQSSTTAPLLQQPPPGTARHHRGGGSKQRTGKPGKGGHGHGIQPVEHRVGPVWPPLRPITRSRPLRLLVTGDSLVGYMGPQILNEAAAQGAVIGWTDTHDGTGLTRPDFVDWSVVAHSQVGTYHPDAVVIMMGGNDFQNMVLGQRIFYAGTYGWTREYQRRAEIVMRKWIDGGVRRVYWLSMPPANNPSWAHDDQDINIALQRAARQVPGVHYVNVLGPITNHGRYTDYVPVNGVQTLIREPDGVHLNIAGSDIVAGEVVPIVKREWQFGWGAMRRRALRFQQDSGLLSRVGATA
ncbi:MAG TPA: DUF459 domain-containing protein [Chloroflexota bacterium]|nr:DUF459 domain-containing protein [Chloroflexota bacterium]